MAQFDRWSIDTTDHICDAAGRRPGRTSVDQFTYHKNNKGTGAADLTVTMLATSTTSAESRHRNRNPRRM